MSSPLVVEDLEVTYPNAHTALHGITFSTVPGTVTAVIGESGSGKSTLARALLGLLPEGGTATGRITLGEHQLGPRHSSARGVRGRVLGYVPQDPVTNLDPLQRIGAALREALAVTGGAADPLELLRSVGFPEPERILRRFPHQLSGGQRQRVLIALALAGSPQTVIADEPTSALDVTVQREVLDLLCGRVTVDGSSLLLITHDIAIALERASHVIVLRDGEVLEAGAPAELGRTPYTRMLLDASTGAGDPPSPAEDGRVLLHGLGLTKRYGRGRSQVRALDDVSFTLHTGETLGIVGSSGSGKTTLARSVLRLVDTDAGTLESGGTDVLAHRGRALRDYRRRIQPVFQNPYASLDPTYTVGRTLAEALRLSGEVASSGDVSARIAQGLEDVGLPVAVTDRLPRELSGGQQQRVAIARALAFSPEVLVLDEAVSALDVIVRARILALLAELQRERGLAYLFVSHDLSVVRRICHRVMVVHEGRIVEEGPTPEVFADPQHPRTQELIAAIPQQHRTAQKEPE